MPYELNLELLTTDASTRKEIGDLVSIDGSLITAVLSMFWADYREGAKKAKTHCGFDINHGIPTQVYLTDGNEAERPFIDQILTEGQTGVMDRGTNPMTFLIFFRAKTNILFVGLNPER